jgi:translation elongation factor EF-Ts
VVGAYAHGGPSRTAGRIGSLVALQAPGTCPAAQRMPCRVLTLAAHVATGGALVPDAAQQSVSQLTAQLAMHVAALQPKYLDLQDVPATVLAAERASFEAQARRALADVARGAARRLTGLSPSRPARPQAASSGKPANIADKMVQGWLQKWRVSRHACPRRGCARRAGPDTARRMYAGKARCVCCLRTL